MLVNSGERTATVQSVILAGGGGDLVLDPAEPCKGDLPAGGRCGFSLHYHPQRPGGNNAALLIQYVSAPAPVDLSIGSGTATGSGPATVTEQPQTVTVPVTTLARPIAAPRADDSALFEQLRQRYDAEDGGREEVIPVHRLVRHNPARDAAYPAGRDQDMAGTIESSYPVDLGRTLLAGSQVVLVIDDRIVSEQCPATVRAHVGRDVYAEHGYAIVLPHGSKVLGTCLPVKNGEMRVPIKWRRITRPDGARALLGDNAGVADQLGGPGLPGDLDNRAMAALADATAISLVDAVVAGVAAIGGGQSQLTNVNGYNVSRTSPLAAGLGQGSSSLSSNTSQVVKQIVNESTNLTPVVTIDYGSLAAMVVRSDIHFKPPEEEEDAADERPLPFPATGAPGAAGATGGSGPAGATGATGAGGVTGGATSRQPEPAGSEQNRRGGEQGGRAGGAGPGGGDGGSSHRAAQGDRRQQPSDPDAAPPDLGPTPDAVNAGGTGPGGGTGPAGGNVNDR